jgi:hypothetical protein
MWRLALSFIRTLASERMSAVHVSPRSSRQSSAENGFPLSSAELAFERISPSTAHGVERANEQNRSKPLLSKKAGIGSSSRFW